MCRIDENPAPRSICITAHRRPQPKPNLQIAGFGLQRVNAQGNLAENTEIRAAMDPQPSRESASEGGPSGVHHSLLPHEPSVLAGQASKTHADALMQRPPGSPLTTAGGGVLARVRHAEVALAGAQKTLREKQLQLDKGERQQQAEAVAFALAMAERQRLADNALRRSRRDAGLAIQRASASWMDPDELQRLLDVAREASGAEPDILAEANAALSVQRQRLRDAREQGAVEGARSEGDLVRQARQTVVRASLIEFIGQVRDGSATANGTAGGHADTPDGTALVATLHRMIGCARRVGVEQSVLSDARTLFRQQATQALQETKAAPCTLEAICRLSDLIDICKESDRDGESQLGTVLGQAQHVLKQHQARRAKLVVTSLNQILLTGAGTSPAQDVALLENAIDTAHDAVTALGDKPESSEDFGRLQQLTTVAQKRLEGRRNELAQLEQERRDASVASWRATRHQLELSISVAKAAVEANDERLRLAVEIERAEVNRRDGAVRQFAAQQMAKAEDEERLRREKQQVLDAKEEVKRLKWSLKVSQDGAHAAVRKAEEEANRVKHLAAEETREAQAEARSRRRELEKVTQRMKSANHRKEREFNEHEQRQVKEFRDQEERAKRLLKEEQARVALQQKMVEDARSEAERLRTEQGQVVGAWQQAEKGATALAAENAKVAKQALEAQQKAEEVARQAQHEVKDMQEEMTKKEEGLKKEMQEQEQAHELERLQAQQATKEAELLKVRQQELLEELKAGREELQRARDKQEELEKFIADQRTEKEQLNEKMREKSNLIKEGDRELKEAKEEINKLRAETADAVEGRRKTRKEAGRLKAEQTEAYETKAKAELEAKDATEKAAAAIKEMDKAKEELRQIEAASAKASAELTVFHKEDVAEMTRKHEKALQQKEDQLEYAEDMLTRMEAKEAARKAKNAGNQQRIDDDVRVAYEKLRVKTDELAAAKKELEQSKAKTKSADSAKGTWKREQKEQEDRFAKQLEQARNTKASLEKQKAEAVQAKEKALRGEMKALDEVEKLREEMELLNARLDEAGGIIRDHEEQTASVSSQRVAPPRAASRPSATSSGPSAEGALSTVDVEQLALAIAIKLQGARDEATPAASSHANRRGAGASREIIETERMPRRGAGASREIIETEPVPAQRDAQRVRREVAPATSATTSAKAATVRTKPAEKPALRLKGMTSTSSDSPISSERPRPSRPGSHDEFPDQGTVSPPGVSARIATGKGKAVASPPSLAAPPATSSPASRPRTAPSTPQRSQRRPARSRALNLADMPKADTPPSHSSKRSAGSTPSTDRSAVGQHSSTSKSPGTGTQKSQNDSAAGLPSLLEEDAAADQPPPDQHGWLGWWADSRQSPPGGDDGDNEQPKSPR